MKFIKVKKGDIVKDVQKAYLEQYTASGWTVVKETAETKEAAAETTETAEAE